MSRFRMLFLAAPCAVVALALVATGVPATAATTVNLGLAAPFAVLAGTTVTNSGPTAATGDLGVWDGTAVTGFDRPGGPGTVTGEIYRGTTEAQQAQSSLTTAYVTTANLPSDFDVTGTNLGNRTLVPGVYTDTSTMDLTGTVTLNGQGDPGAVFIFQAGSSLTAAGSSTVAFIGGAQPCNVFWQVTSSASIGTDADFAGTIMALTSISVNTGATIQGRLLARNGAVTLLSNEITRPTCAAPPPPAPTTAAPTATATPTTTPTATSTPTATATSTPTATATSTPTTTATATPTSTSTPTTAPSTTATANPSDAPGSDGPGGGSPSAPDGGTDGGSNGGGSNGSGSGSGNDSGIDTGFTAPVVPSGHPETGMVPAEDRGATVWLLGGMFCVGGATAAAVAGSRRRVTLPRS